MKRISYFLPLVLILAISFISFTPYNTNTGPVKWALNKAQSSVTFSLTHLVIAKLEGSFKTFDGTLENTKPDFSDGHVTFTVDAASIDTDNEDRDGHLRSDDYFDVAKYPKIRFESTSFKHSRGKNYKLGGNLTIKNVTKLVVFDVVYESGTTDKGAKATFTCTTVINRYDYNISSGGAAINKEVTLNAKVQMDEMK